MIYKSRFDTVSILLSLFCTVHCILLPLFLTTVPLLGFELLENRLIEVAVVLLSAGIGGYAIKRGFLKFHKNAPVVIIFIAGLILMIAGNFASFAGEVVFKLIGAVLIILSHIKNWRLSKKCSITSKPNSGIAFAE